MIYPSTASANLDSKVVVVVYGDLLSQPTRMVLQVAACLNVPVDFQRVNLMAGDLQTKSFLAMNPMGQMPTLRQGDFTLFESNAISRFLVASSGNANHPLYPSDVKTRARIDQWLDWKHGGLREGCTGTLRRSFFAEMVNQLDESKTYAAKLKRYLNEVPVERETRLMLEALKTVEDQLAITGLFIVQGTTQPTLADIALFEEIDALSMLPFIPPVDDELRPPLVFKQNYASLPIYKLMRSFFNAR